MARESDLNIPDKLCYSVKECALALGCCQRVVWDLISKGRLSHLKIGRRVLVPVAVLQDYVVNNTTAYPNLIEVTSKLSSECATNPGAIPILNNRKRRQKSF